MGSPDPEPGQQRQRELDEREIAAEVRSGIADQRDSTADRRDAAADQRDSVSIDRQAQLEAWERRLTVWEEALAAREKRLHEREAGRLVSPPEATEFVREVLRRAHAALDQASEALDRVVAREALEESERERSQAAIEREMRATERTR